MIQIAILGFGVVGSGTAEVLTQNKALIEERLGCEVYIKYILDLRDFPDSPFADRIVHDFNVILQDPDVSIVAEMMGGSHPAYDFSKACLEAGKSVVTSNKEVVSKFGAELLALAKAKGARYLFEASVGGGIPIIRPMINDLCSNRIASVNGILNGTTNYILTQMKCTGQSFEAALSDAQKKGYAEANPTADVEGIDAARKIAILAALSFGKLIYPDTVAAEGITALTTPIIEAADAMGYAVKLIGHTEQIDGKILAMVSPRLVPANNPLAGVDDVFNGILVNANMVGDVMFYGPGAGKLPTASAVVADIIDIIAHRHAQVKAPEWQTAKEDDVYPVAAYACEYGIMLQGGEVDVPALTETLGERSYRILDGVIAFVTEAVTPDELEAMLKPCELPVIATIRLLNV